MTSVWRDEKGQAGSETLLILAGVVLVATLVALYLKSALAGTQPIVQNQTNQTIQQINT